MSKVDVIEYLISKKIHNFESKKEFFQFFGEAPKKYKRYEIPKRTSGTRTIAQPIRELKDYQRALIELFQHYFPIHSSSMAYVKGKDIKSNAEVHSQNIYFLKMDFTDFFNSITPNNFWKACERSDLKFDWLEKEVIEKAIFWKPSKYSKKLILSIGAPSSPFISNFIMYSFDDEITRYCEDKGITYTRYADDMTFSTNIPNSLFILPEQVRGLLIKFYGNAIKINHLKTVFSSKKHNRHVTGITITNNDELSIGRAKKRYIKHLVHNYIEEKISLDDLNYLRGYLGFVKYVEPNFLISLEKKYTQTVIQKIRLGS
ncbi:MULTISPECIES: retron St85 family RNA-directed DNA polymerase [unclassified Acinetobacter]|uniref:retron St85 family RNA-directed DNA polymerase n=1 Tax=unclassified Acinetobacter TaxID=196816 RepID=UPI002575C1D3|nr:MULTISPECIES: retron St85 family RNA-directed DNA polymerase [unclassified Acinetobacter]MDM1764056.1 RNA-directed DNA polymerase [Acinetobacter sp. 226-1]MDM1768987.1 RNA-directed DNA polymerase [Acinetobacter sp. 226-4]